MRAMMGLPNALEHRQGILTGFSGAIGAFRYLGELTEDEERDWRNRMLVALGIDPPEPAPPGVSRAIFVGDPKAQPMMSPEPPPIPQFVCSVVGPDIEVDLHGGRLRVLGIDIYDTKVLVRWRVAPQPDVALVCPEEEAQLLRDIEGTDDWAAEELRKKAHNRLRAMRLYQFDLSDDVGPQYTPSGRHAGGGANEMAGEAEFTPTPPEGAYQLTVLWHGLAVPVPL